MEIIYYLKNLKLSQQVKDFVKNKIEKLKKFIPEESLIEIEIFQTKEKKEKEGIYKTKIIVDLPKKQVIIIESFGKTILQSINNSFKKLKRELTQKF